MEDLSEQTIKTDCPHCNNTSYAFKCVLEQTERFYIVCDAHPLTEGHILIIPKQHVACIGEYPKDLFEEFLVLNKKISKFLIDTYGSVSSFEHGIFAQTVFHSHIHYLPFNGKALDIVPENKILKLNDLSELKVLFKNNGGYLFFSLNNILMSVDVSLAASRFFRDRFAAALGKPERGNWKNMHASKKLMEKGEEENIETQRKWKEYFYSLVNSKT
jgi:diadenosine tetraphosphate (Ap4A) HIT family hydrolase